MVVICGAEEPETRISNSKDIGIVHLYREYEQDG